MWSLVIRSPQNLLLPLHFLLLPQQPQNRQQARNLPPSAQPVDQETTEQAPTNEGATYEAEPSDDFEDLVNQVMNEFGFSREKAEEIVSAGQQAAAEEQQRLEESSAAAQERIEKEKAEAAAEADSYWMERYGITAKEAMGMSPDELNALFDQKHGG